MSGYVALGDHPGYQRGTSAFHQWDRIVNLVESSPWPHERVLDIGAGMGKGAYLLDEYLNVKPLTYSAVEADVGLAGRLATVCGLYNHVATGRAIDFVGMFPFEHFDTVLMVDVIEHMDKVEAWIVIDACPGQVVISTPYDAQVEAHAATNGTPPLERHVSQWTLDDFTHHERYETHRTFAGRTAATSHLLIRLRPEQG